MATILTDVPASPIRLSVKAASEGASALRYLSVRRSPLISAGSADVGLSASLCLEVAVIARLWLCERQWASDLRRNGVRHRTQRSVCTERLEQTHTSEEKCWRALSTDDPSQFSSTEKQPRCL